MTKRAPQRQTLKAWAIGALVIGVAVLAFDVAGRRNRDARDRVEHTDAPGAGAPVTTGVETHSTPAGSAGAGSGSAGAGSPLAKDLLQPNRPAADEVAAVRELISQYLSALQRQPGPPIGDNADLVRALTGNNPLRLTVIPPDHAAISGQGLLLDRWGTPYFIHPESSHRFEVRSAGPDRKLRTTDDVVAP